MKTETSQKLTAAQQTEVIARVKKGDMYTTISKDMELPYTTVNKFMTKWKRDNGLLAAGSKKKAGKKKSSKKATKKKVSRKTPTKKVAIATAANIESPVTQMPVANATKVNATHLNASNSTPAVKPHTVNVSELEFLRKFYFNSLKSNLSSATVH